MFSIFFSVICAWFAYFLPAYATFKALSKRPVASAPVAGADVVSLEPLCMYWTVVGLFVGFEYVAGWFVSWLPFYWELKTIFLLFLSLPQVQGSTFVYTSYLAPFLQANEQEIDAGIVALQSNILAFVQDKLAALWNLVVNKGQQPLAQGTYGQQPQQGQGQVPNLSFENAMGLFKTYGPGLINHLPSAGNRPGPNPNPSPSASSTSIPSMSAESRSSYASSTESEISNPWDSQPPPFPQPVHQ
ncbi:receptor expression-enhancing protein 4 [Moniliophthora roreri MCA 2997]|uniref:Protein YOP1 n=2 Tax=Moniliophthora roreri TaxID=221103 RepID=V2XYV7_MONRO|nr:receptor expression-enhancing protein 4 [Moniliophthora roreri MCA 2997]KAI3622446.1 receptor expression-enhancing protein 4 [Moniliophthora roreri]